MRYRRGGLYAPRKHEAGEFALKTGGGSGAVPTCRSMCLEESDKGVGDALETGGGSGAVSTCRST